MTMHEIADELAAVFKTLTGYTERLHEADTSIRVPPSPERAAIMVHQLRMKLVNAYLAEHSPEPGPDDQEALNLRFPLR